MFLALLDARRIIEVYAAGKCAQKITAEEIDRLNALASEMELHAQDPETVAKTDYVFHMESIIIAENPVIRVMLNSIGTIFRFYLKRYYKTPGNTEAIRPLYKKRKKTSRKRLIRKSAIFSRRSSYPQTPWPISGTVMPPERSVWLRLGKFGYTRFPNGINFNVKFQAAAFADQSGLNALGSILKVYFQQGGMQAQVNMIDPEMLMDARNNPDLYPHLLIRVSGYSACFNDLSPQMKDEIISRSFNEISS